MSRHTPDRTVSSAPLLPVTVGRQPPLRQLVRAIRRGNPHLTREQRRDAILFFLRPPAVGGGSGRRQ